MNTIWDHHSQSKEEQQQQRTHAHVTSTCYNTCYNASPDRLSMCGSSSCPPCLHAVRWMEGPGGGLGLTGVAGCGAASVNASGSHVTSLSDKQHERVQVEEAESAGLAGVDGCRESTCQCMCRSSLVLTKRWMEGPGGGLGLTGVGGCGAASANACGKAVQYQVEGVQKRQRVQEGGRGWLHGYDCI
jgi:hypothetical protein